MCCLIRALEIVLRDKPAVAATHSKIICLVCLKKIDPKIRWVECRENVHLN